MENKEYKMSKICLWISAFWLILQIGVYIALYHQGIVLFYTFLGIILLFLAHVAPVPALIAVFYGRKAEKKGCKKARHIYAVGIVEIVISMGTTIAANLFF